MTDYARLNRERGSKLAPILINGMSAMCYENLFHEGFNMAIREIHPTFQQDFGRLVIAWLRDVAERKTGIDGRNAALVEFAKSIKEQLGPAYLPRT